MKEIAGYIYGTRKMSFMLLGTSQLMTLFSVIKDLYNDTFQFEESFEIFVIFLFAGIFGSIWFIMIEFLQDKRHKIILKKVEWNKIKEGNFILSDQYTGWTNYIEIKGKYNDKEIIMFVTSEKKFWKNVYYLYIFIEHFDKKIGKIKIDKNLDADKINQVIKDGLLAKIFNP